MPRFALPNVCTTSMERVGVCHSPLCFFFFLSRMLQFYVRLEGKWHSVTFERIVVCYRRRMLWSFSSTNSTSPPLFTRIEFGTSVLTSAIALVTRACYCFHFCLCITFHSLGAIARLRRTLTPDFRHCVFLLTCSQKTRHLIVINSLRGAGRGLCMFTLLAS